jgi:Na+-driven multidrug efflux pump
MFSFFFMAIILYQSIGDAKTAGFVMILREVVFFIPFVIILPIWWGLTGIYATPVIQNIITLTIAIYLVFKLFKKWDMETV